LLGAFGATGLAPGVKGELCGLQFEHGPIHVLRSIVEGLACELRRHLEFMEHAGMPARRLIMTGGAAAGAVTPQVVSDVTGLPVHCLGGEGSVRGAVVLARGLLEKKANLARLAEAMVPPGRLVKPGPAQAAYEQVYAAYLSGLPVARHRASV
jgi:xylulokinase